MLIKKAILSVFILTFMGCASHPKIVKTPCPPRPLLNPVEVTDGELNRENTKHVIDNWERVWEYIHRIEKLGCVR